MTKSATCHSKTRLDTKKDFAPDTAATFSLQILVGALQFFLGADEKPNDEESDSEDEVKFSLSLK